MRLITLSLAWLIGIVIADLLHLPLPPLLAAAALFGLAAAMAGRAPRLRLALLALCCAALGGARLGNDYSIPRDLEYTMLYFRRI